MEALAHTTATVLQASTQQGCRLCCSMLLGARHDLSSDTGTQIRCCLNRALPAATCYCQCCTAAVKLHTLVLHMKRSMSATDRNSVSCCMLNSQATSDSQLHTIMRICGVMCSPGTPGCSRKLLLGDSSCSRASSFLQGNHGADDTV